MMKKTFLFFLILTVGLAMQVNTLSVEAESCPDECTCYSNTEDCPVEYDAYSYGCNPAATESVCCCLIDAADEEESDELIIGGGNGITIQNPLQAEKFEVILDNLINFIFNIAVVLAPLMIIIAGFLFVTAGGNLEQIKRAKAIIIWTAVGFFIILLARGIMGIINNILGVR